MNKTALIFGGISVDWFGVIVAAACLIGVCVACLLRKYQKGSVNDVLTVFCVGAPLAVIFGRLQYCLSELDLSQTGIGSIFTEMNEGGYGLYGAIGGVLAAVFISAAVWQVSAGKLADCVAAVSAGVIAAGRFATKFTPDERGFALDPGTFTVHSETDGLDYLAVYLLDGIVETVIFAVCLGLFFFIYGKKHERRSEGKLTMVFLTLHGLNQVVMDSLRMDSLCLFNNDFIKASQIIGILSWLIVISIFFYQAVKNQKKFPKQYWVIIAVFVVLIVISISKEYRVGSSNYISAHVTMGICMVIMAAISMYIFFESEKRPVQAKASEHRHVRSGESQSMRSSSRQSESGRRTSSEQSEWPEMNYTFSGHKQDNDREIPNIDLGFDNTAVSGGQSDVAFDSLSESDKPKSSVSVQKPDSSSPDGAENTRVSKAVMDEIRRQFDKM